MSNRAVFYFHRGMARFLSHDDMVSVSGIRRQETYFREFIRAGQSTNIVSIGNRYASWKQISGIKGSFIWSEIIISGYGGKIQICTAIIRWKGVVEAVTNHSFVLFSRLKFLVPD